MKVTQNGNGRVANEPILKVDYRGLDEGRVSRKELVKYLPRYILNPLALHYSRMKKCWFSVAQIFLRALVRIYLRPRSSLGELSQSEVDAVYDREAATYDLKHHLTTRGIDLVWRRIAGWFILSLGHNGNNDLRVLDLCTGTGLTAQEIVRVATMGNVNVSVIGLDYNQRMLEAAKRKTGSNGHIEFALGDATDLIKNSGKESTARQFTPNTFDAVTQIFGIGGVPKPLKVFDGVLSILKPGGQFLMIDMHKPIPELPGEWPFLLRWFRFPVFEMVAYEQSTIPLVLNRLWGWRDTTLLFYLLPLVTYRDEDGRYWGFEVRSFEQESQRWWFGLPIMPVAKISVEKAEIDEKTFRVRETILRACIPR